MVSVAVKLPEPLAHLNPPLAQCIIHGPSVAANFFPAAGMNEGPRAPGA